MTAKPGGLQVNPDGHLGGKRNAEDHLRDPHADRGPAIAIPL